MKKKRLKPGRYDYRRIDPISRSRDRVFDEMLHEIGPRLLRELIDAGPTMVKADFSVTQESDQFYPRHGFVPGPVLHTCLEIEIKRTRTMNVTLPKLDPGPPVRVRTIEEPRPTACRRFVKFLRAEWARAGTDPGLPYDGPRG